MIRNLLASLLVVVGSIFPVTEIWAIKPPYAISSVQDYNNRRPADFRVAAPIYNEFNESFYVNSLMCYTKSRGFSHYVICLLGSGGIVFYELAGNIERAKVDNFYLY
jgi:hypothetical protein